MSTKQDVVKVKLTSEQIVVLNEARSILVWLEEHAGDVGYARSQEDLPAFNNRSRGVMACGRLAQAADVAEEAIFKVLSVARAYADVEVGDDELFNNRQAVEA